MALEEVGIDLGNLSTQLISGLFEKFAWLAGLIKAVGIFVIIYIIYLLIKAFRDMKMRSRIKNINEKVEILEKKLDKLLSREESKKKNQRKENKEFKSKKKK